MQIMLMPFKKTNGQYDFRDLFIYTSLQCNLQCHHCFVSSSPLNKTLDTMTLADLKPLLEEAKLLGVHDIYFTGGEPFLNPEIIQIIDASLSVAPVTIYTNATQPLNARLKELSEVTKKHKNKILLRVSLDHYDPEIHEVFYGRGKGNFQLAIETAAAAAQAGIKVAITTQEDIHNNAGNEEVKHIFTNMFSGFGVQLSDVKVLPSIPQGEQLKRTQPISVGPVSSEEFSASGTSRESLMCHVGRTLIKYEEAVRVFPCTILIPPSKASIPLFAKYELGRTLNESLEKEQPLDHPSCRAYCVKGKQTCSNR